VLLTKRKILREAKVASEPEALICLVPFVRFDLERIGLEAAPCRNGFLRDAEAGLAVELLETRHVRKDIRADAGKVGSQRCSRDAQLIAGWFRRALQIDERAENRTLLTARKLVQSKLTTSRTVCVDPARFWSQGRQDDGA